MKVKLLGLSLVACLMAVAAWLVHRNDGTESEFAQSSHAREPQASQAAKDLDKKYRETAAKGLEYLVKHQFPDGHWEGDGGKHPVAMTGLVGLALLMETELPIVDLLPLVTTGKYTVNLRKAADWLMEHSLPKRDGLIFSEHPSETARYMEGHGLATLFLAGVCRQESDPARRKKLTEVVTRAVRYIGTAQSSQGGWYHTSRAEGHDFDENMATAIQVQALQAAENAGNAIPGGAIDDGLEYLKRAIDKLEHAKPDQQSSRPAETAAALTCRLNLGFNSRLDGDKGAWTKTWLKYCQTAIPSGRDTRFGKDELAHHYYAQALFSLGGDAWDSYRRTMFDHLVRVQNNDGSWPASTGISTGAVYSTALWCTVLQLDKRTHPSRRPDPPAPITMARTGVRLGFVVKSAAQPGA
jgi:hypothetical protein